MSQPDAFSDVFLMLKQDLLYVHFLSIPFQKKNCVYAFIVPPSSLSFSFISSSLTS